LIDKAFVTLLFSMVNKPFYPDFFPFIFSMLQESRLIKKATS